MAVSLGYKNVYRYPEGYPEWLDKGFPVSVVDLFSSESVENISRAVPVPSGLHFLIVLVGVFIGGVALNLTPCIYPLIPITVSYFGGRSGAGTGKTILHGLSYIMGLALTNSTLGVFAALTGGVLGSLLQNSLILIGISAILVLFALSLFGLWEIRLPIGFSSLASKSYGGYGGSLFMGLTLGIVAAPCIGPFVIGLLGWIAAIGKAWFGFTVFFILSLGMGMPLFFLAVFSGKIHTLPHSGEWLLWVKKTMGWILVGMAAYFIRPLLSETISVGLYAVIALGAGIHLGWLETSSSASPGFKRFRRVIGIACLGFGVTISALYVTRPPGVSWTRYHEGVIKQASVAGKPVIVDFYAAWCTPCRELETTTFHDPEVVALADQVSMIKIDLTSEASPEYEALLTRFEIKGVPTVLFIDKTGAERRDLRSVDYLPPDDFLERMKKLL